MSTLSTIKPGDKVLVDVRQEFGQPNKWVEAVLVRWETYTRGYLPGVNCPMVVAGDLPKAPLLTPLGNGEFKVKSMDVRVPGSNG